MTSRWMSRWMSCMHLFLPFILIDLTDRWSIESNRLRTVALTKSCQSWFDRWHWRRIFGVQLVKQVAPFFMQVESQVFDFFFALWFDAQGLPALDLGLFMLNRRKVVKTTRGPWRCVWYLCDRLWARHFGGNSGRSKPGRSVRGERANFSRLVLGWPAGW